MILYDTTLSLMINIRYMTHTHIHDESISNILLIYGPVVYLVSSINIYIIFILCIFCLPGKEAVSDYRYRIVRKVFQISAFKSKSVPESELESDDDPPESELEPESDDEPELEDESEPLVFADDGW